MRWYKAILQVPVECLTWHPHMMTNFDITKIASIDAPFGRRQGAAKDFGYLAHREEHRISRQVHYFITWLIHSAIV